MTGGTTLRAFSIGLVAIAVALGAALVGGNLSPRVARVEQKVVAPAVNAVTAPRAPLAGGDMADMIAAACPAIVAIDRGAWGQDGAASGGGTAAPPPRATGFIVSAEGYILASGQAVAGTAPLRVLLDDGRSLGARRVADDPLSGVALLKVDGSGFPALALAESALAPVGTQAVALVAPEAHGCIADPLMVSADFASGRPGPRAFVQLRPTPDPAFAGAPALDRNGQVIGIVGLGGAGSGADPALLLPAGTLSRVYSALLRSDSAAANDFGFVAQDLSPALAARIGTDRQQGAMIALIAPGSAAARAGLLAGDVIFTAGGTPVANATELSRALDGAGDVVTLDVMRRADRISITMRSR
ncbi:hypothetical protein GCM10023232_09220 [Sphingosinicella ginsenosidimutans]|uniref:Serine protease n=1 Tax=Allosphingosinicella ginsenosidimutans TaxID=1176539 RepID=A0A5C6TYK1_9SPHN|nr:S1C family serine protease [Sphingosinicella ginsenosidimutans]TXC64725.1 serine protease [Sphingosinicella ginsenosidimutans]